MDIQNLVKIKYPIFQGGMANIATAEFAANVSNAGALGIIASGAHTAKSLREEIQHCKQMTDQPFGVNLMLMSPYIDEIAEMIIEEDVKIVTTGAGNPAKYMKKWLDNQIKVIPVISTTALAKKMENLGASALIAEGNEAGGHIGKMTTMTLVPEIVANVDIPVIAAGGIASGSQMLAAEVLGASGVQIGTLFLSSCECPIHPEYKKAILNAKSSRVTTFGEKTGVGVRALRTPMVNEYIALERDGANIEELEQLTLGALRRAVNNGDYKRGSFMCGLCVGQVNEEKTLNNLLRDIMFDYQEKKEKICKK